MTTKPPDPTLSAPSPTDAELFPIVGIGASAGGLEALTKLLKALPPAPGMAFVVVQHLAPAHPSALAEILSRATPMPVQEVQGTQVVMPDHVYVIPPGRSMVLVGEELQLRPRETEGHYPINQFFNSLAEHRGHRAIGVVLSGTATDGTLGLARIKGEAGITFAQDATAQHDGMPSSAIDSGCVDFVLPPDAIAREIVRLGRQPMDLERAVAPQPGDRSDLAQIVRLLHDTTGVDFAQYRFATLFRRVTRRVAFAMQPSLAAYLQFLRKTPGEIDALYQDILIHVTSFFRDPEAFEVLKRLVFPRLIAGRSAHEPVRFWALACSTGQEAYSLAIAFREAADAAGSAATLQLFATDLNAKCIAKARAGIYPKEIALDVSPDRLQKYFTEVDGHYRICKSIRDVCIFSQHNVLTDPPFLRIDLISCRNLLIYLDLALHHKILPTLHLALQEQGCLWLGGSETADGHRKLFEVLDATQKIYRKIPGRSQRQGSSPHYPASVRPAALPPVRLRPIDGSDLPREADRILSNRFAPPCVLVSAELDIVHYRGDTGPFLGPAPGKASLNLLKMLREGLLVGVNAAIMRSRQEGAAVREVGLQVKYNGSFRDVDIEVVPIGAFGGKPGGFLILFVAADSAPDGVAGSAPIPTSVAPGASSALPPDPERVRLALELAATREYLQSLTEMQDAAIEELQSANEEVQSANEELQSTSEEMETSKEELQSSHEELTTVNHQLNDLNSELTRVNNDLANVLASVDMAIVLIGQDMCVRRFTPTAAALLSLVASDVGRPLADLPLRLDGTDELAQLLAEVLESNSPRECEAQARLGRWYSLRLRPYRTPEGRTEGVVLMLVDVDVLKRINAYTESIVATVREPLLVLDRELRVLSASRAFYETFRVLRAETENRLLFELGDRQWDIPELRRLLEELLPRDNQVDDFEVERHFKQIGQRTMILNARRLLQGDGETPLILLAIEDVTERKAAAAAMRDGEVRYRTLFNSMDEGFCVIEVLCDADGKPVDYRFLDANRAFHQHTGLADVVGKRMTELTTDLEKSWFETYGQVATSGESIRFTREAKSLGRWFDLQAFRLGGAESRTVAVLFLDVSARKQTDAAIEKQNSRLKMLWEATGVLLSTDDAGAMLHGLLTKIGPHLGVDTYLSYSVDAKGGALNLMGSDGVPEAIAESITRLDLGQAIDGSAALQRQSIVVSDVQQSSDPKAELARSMGLQAYISNPLVAGNVLMGTLSFASRSKGHFDADELAFLQTVSNYVAVAYARMRAQTAVHQSEGRLRFLIDSMPQMITTATPHGDVDYCNPQWSEFTGLPAEQLNGWGWLQCIHADDVAQHELVWRLAVETGEVFEFDSRIRRADGQYRWHVTRSMPMPAEDRRVLMWVSSTTDVHDIKHVEAALQDSETRYRRLFEAAKDGILILDFVNGEIIDANPYMTDLLGYSHADFRGRQLWEIGLFGDKAANEAAVRELQDKRYLRYDQLPIESKQGRKVMVEVVANAYKEEQHRVIQCNIRDVTERSVLQEQMRGQAVELSDLHRRKDEFLAMLSHELRNPLASITNAVRLLGLEQDNESRIQQQARGIIERQMGQLGHLVDDLLEVSRITTGRLQLRRERVAVNDVVARALETVRPTYELRQQEMAVSMPSERIWLYADAARLEQVLVNLLANAIKFTDHGGHIWLTVGREGDECVLRVGDDGVGIAPELLPRIFDLFTQSDQSLDRSQGGLGIGLTLVHRLTELHGGSVAAHSTLGQGSEFVVRLPIATGEVVPMPPPPVPPDASPAPRRLRVLLVDDNVDTLLSFEMLLRAVGHDVRTAADGAAALRVVSEYRPDVVLLDIGLPGMNGYEVAKRIRQQADVAGTVLIALTGYGQAADRLATKDAGFDHHLVKPANFTNLEKILVGVAAKVC